ncbi:MAG: glycosyltransferase family 9 protein, partial [Kiloniellaceae bacterium]
VLTATRVGDAVLSTGLLDHLIRENPDARVTVACGPMAAPLFEAVPNLERIIVLEKKAFSLHWVRLWAACVGRYWDVLVDLRNSPMPYLLAARARRRRGGGREPVHRVRQLAQVAGLEAEPPAPRLWVAEKHQAKARALVPDGPPVLAVGPTANWEAKMWGAGNFTQLVGRLCAADGILPGARVAVFGHAAERPAARGLIDAIPPERCIDLVGQGDLLAVFACLRRCAFYVGNDSGLMHMAAASGVPTLGLFGPSDPGRYAPWGPLTAVARTAIPFEELVGAPDFDHRATASLMDSLSVDAAETAARALWRRCQGQAACTGAMRGMPG